MRKVSISILLVFLSIVVWADRYKILQLNTPQVKIGNRLCSKGDVFSDESVIYWSQKNQAFKAQNLETKEIKLFIESDFRAKGCSTIKEYYLKTNHLSSRGSDSTALDEISDTIFLCDSVIMEMPVLMDTTHYCYIVYDNENGKIKKRLKHQDQSFIIDKKLFGEDVMREDLRVSLFYHMPEEEYPLKDSLTIMFVPWEY
jgi:hypothetical protein